VLAEVGHATEHHERILSSAVDKADGLGDADLKRLKYVVTNLKGGVLELSAHARFVDGTQQRARALFACLVRAHALCRAAVNENLSPEEVYAQFDGDQVRPSRRCAVAHSAAYETLCPDS
jgi:hypothetical protein